MNNKLKKVILNSRVDGFSTSWTPAFLAQKREHAEILSSLNGGFVETTKKDLRRRYSQELKNQPHKEYLESNGLNNNTISNDVNRYGDVCSYIPKVFESRRFKDESRESKRLFNCEVGARYELKKMFEGELEVDTSVSFYDGVKNLRGNLGVDLIDTICCGEITRVVCFLNNAFTAETYRWTVRPNSSGRFNYTYSATLLVDGSVAGIVAWGGKNLGCYISIMGTGCEGLDIPRFYQEIKNIPGIKLTRLDLAYDDHSGKHSVAVARKFAKKGGFSTGGRPSSYMYVESGTLSEKYLKDNFKEIKELSGQKTNSTAKKSLGFMPSKGRTLYIGSRESGKLLRVYEKGKQMGDTKDKWVRWELELRANQRVIPLEAMIKPSEYLAGAYPALSFLNEEQCVIKTIVKKTKMTVEKIIENQIRSTRKAINMMRVVCGFSDSEIVDKFLKDIEDPFSRESLPKRLSMVTDEQSYLDSIKST